MHGHGAIISDHNSAGHFIFENIQPLLQQLLIALTFEQIAPFIESNTIAIKSALTSYLSMLDIQARRYSSDKEGIAGLSKFFTELNPNFEDLPTAAAPLVDSVSDALSSKIRVYNLQFSRQKI